MFIKIHSSTTLHLRPPLNSLARTLSPPKPPPPSPRRLLRNRYALPHFLIFLILILLPSIAPLNLRNQRREREIGRIPSVVKVAQHIPQGPIDRIQNGACEALPQGVRATYWLRGGLHEAVEATSRGPSFNHSRITEPGGYGSAVIVEARFPWSSAHFSWLLHSASRGILGFG